MFLYTFIMLIIIRKIIEIKNYIKNESTIALLVGKLLSTTESIFNMQFLLMRPPLAVVAWVFANQLIYACDTNHIYYLIIVEIILILFSTD